MCVCVYPNSILFLPYRWSCDGLLSVGREDDDIFMSYKDKNPFVINYIGVSTAWGAIGEWRIEGMSPLVI